MANYVSNSLAIVGGTLRDVDIFTLNRDNEAGYEDFLSIDFNKIKAMPETIHNTDSGSMTAPAIMYYLTDRGTKFPLDEETEKLAIGAINDGDSLMMRLFRVNLDEEFKRVERELKHTDPDKLYAMGENYVNNFKSYGHSTWYGWSVVQWGCKSNAWESAIKEDDLDNNVVYLTTPNSAPHEVIEALSKLYPDFEFVLTWADEDQGFNTGKMTWKDGVVLKSIIPEPQSVLAEKYYLETWENGSIAPEPISK